MGWGDGGWVDIDWEGIGGWKELYINSDPIVPFRTAFQHWDCENSLAAKRSNIIKEKKLSSAVQSSDHKPNGFVNSA